MTNTKNNHTTSTRVDSNGNAITRMHSSMKRPRAPIACIRCHHKKVRCDGEHPNCTRCTQGGILCAYPSSRRSRNTQSTSVDPFIDNLSQLEIKIQQIEADLESQRTLFLSFQVHKANPAHSMGSADKFQGHHTLIYQNSQVGPSGTKAEHPITHSDQTALDPRRAAPQSRLNKEPQQTRKTQKESSKKKRSFPLDTVSHQIGSNKKSKLSHQNHTTATDTIKTPTSLSSSSVSSLSSASSSSSPSSASSLTSSHLFKAKMTENSNIMHHPPSSSPDSGSATQTLSQHYLFPTLDPFSCHTMADWMQPSNQNNIASQIFFSDQTQLSSPPSQKHQQDHPSYPIYSNFSQQNHNPPPPQSLASQHTSPLITPDYTNDAHDHLRLLSSSNYSIDDSTQNQTYPLTSYPNNPAASTLNHTPSSYPTPSSACSNLLQQPTNNAGHIMNLYNNFTVDDLISFDSENPTAPIMDNTVWYC